VTLSFADRYIYAARAGVEYEEVTQDFYANTPGEVVSELPYMASYGCYL